MTDFINDLQTNFDEELAKQQPDFFYNGDVPEDNDAMDFVKTPLKGVRLG